MNHSTQQLTRSLQELSRREKSGADTQPLIAHSANSLKNFTAAPEIERFLEQTREYSRATRDVNVGTY